MTDEREHPVKQEIARITIRYDVETIPDVISASVEFGFTVGADGITSIEACTKSGMHANIPYVRVWRGDVAVAEFCQHQIVGVYFKPPA